MKHMLRGLLAMAAAALILLPAATRAQTTAPADSTWTNIGEIRGDTLFVSRDRVIAEALLRNEMLAASSAMRDAAAADAQGALRGFLPQVQVAEFFLRSDDALNSFGYKLQNRTVTQQDFNPTLLNNPGETNHFVTRLQLRQPIFNGGMGINGKQAADPMSRAAEFQHQRAEEAVRYHAIQAFEGLALAKSYERVMLAATESATGHVRQAQSMVDNEMATAADLLQAQVYLSGVTQKLIEVRNMMAVAGENIKLLTATNTTLPLAADMDPAEIAGGAPFNDLPPGQVLARADILARREEVDAAGQMVAVAQGTMLPHVNLSLQRDFYSQENLFGDDARSWTLGVYATWDIFKGMQNISEIRKAKAHKRAAQHMADFETRQAAVQATEAWLGARAAHEKVLVATDAVTAAREGLRIVSNQYREGLASMVNLLDTQAAATMAEGSLVQALHDFNVGMANLAFAGSAASGIQENPTPDQ